MTCSCLEYFQSVLDSSPVEIWDRRMEIKKIDYDSGILGVYLILQVSYATNCRWEKPTGVTNRGVRSVYLAREGWNIRYSCLLNLLETKSRASFPIMSSVEMKSLE